MAACAAVEVVCPLKSSPWRHHHPWLARLELAEAQAAARPRSWPEPSTARHNACLLADELNRLNLGLIYSRSTIGERTRKPRGDGSEVIGIDFGVSIEAIFTGSAR